MAEIPGIPVMARVDDLIAKLPKLRPSRVHALWQKVYRSEPPVGAKREFLVRLLAYALQESAPMAFYLARSLSSWPFTSRTH